MTQQHLPEALQPQKVLDSMKSVYRYQSTHLVRSVIRRTGKTRFIKDTDWERGVFGRVWQRHGGLPKIMNTVMGRWIIRCIPDSVRDLIRVLRMTMCAVRHI